MTREEMIAAAEDLARALEGETALLGKARTAGFAAAADAGERKRRAVEGFVAARARFAAAGGTGRPDPALQQRIGALRGLVEENRLALERALAIQGRVMQVIAKAAQRPAGGGGYGALRRMAGPGFAGPGSAGQGGAVAFSVSA